MCRFLLVKSNQPINPHPLLKDFAAMAKASRTPDNDWQGDGWGFAYQKQAPRTGGPPAGGTPPRWKQSWQTYKSLKPIWQDQKSFNQFPPTKLFMAHARSASFADQKGVLDYNQPYVDGNLAFVFNGLIRGVKFPHPIPGKIGAQKIFWLLERQLKTTASPTAALNNLHRTLLKSSTSLRGLNVGIAHGNTLAALCAYHEDKDYFTLHYHQDKNISIICSQPLGSFSWSKMKQGQIIIL